VAVDDAPFRDPCIELVTHVSSRLASRWTNDDNTSATARTLLTEKDATLCSNAFLLKSTSSIRWRRYPSGERVDEGTSR